MKRFLVIFSLAFFWTSQAYSLGCGLESDVLTKQTSYGYLEVNIYNPNSKSVRINSIIYYKGCTKIRTYDLWKTVGAKSNLAFNHATNKAFLKRIDSVNFGCEIVEPKKYKPIKKKKKSWSQKTLDKIKGN